MKKIIRLQSVSDIITNSSSEVFLMSKTDGDHFDDFRKRNGELYIHHIKSFEDLREDYYDLFKQYNPNLPDYQWGDYEDWEEYIEFYTSIDDSRKEFEKLVGLCIVEIGDHYDFDQWEEDRDYARSNKLAYESWH